MFDIDSAKVDRIVEEVGMENKKEIARKLKSLKSGMKTMKSSS